MCTNVNACDYIRGCLDTTTESALKVDAGRKIPCHTGELNLRWQRASLMLYQLSYSAYIIVHLKQCTISCTTSKPA